MNIKTGTDIIEIERIRDSFEDTEGRFAYRVFTTKEIEFCESKGKQKYQHYAARFAAKEAVFKAISETLKSKYEISWQDVEILNDENGRPYVNLKIENNVKNIDVSMSHCKQYAIANVVVCY